jgi:predicted nicotinamide N-methyase
VPQLTASFILRNTASGTAPDVPEVRLRLADEAIGLWEATEAESGGGELPPPFWAFAWAGGIALARYVLDHPAEVAGKTVLDLASGGGLVAIAAARAGARSVRANEIDPAAAEAIVLNAAANGVELDVELGDLLDRDTDAEVVLAGDVFYTKNMSDRVLTFLTRARSRGSRVLVGDPDRPFIPRQRFASLGGYDVRTTVALESTPVKRTTVWALI